MSNRRETLRSKREGENSGFDPARRQVLKALALGALGLIASGIAKSPEISLLLNNRDQQCDSGLDQVRNGIVKPQEYLQMQENCLSEVAEAEKAGLLKGLLYQPSDQKMETILRELFSTRANDEQSLRYLVKSSMDSYNSFKGAGRKDLAVIVPGIIATFGQKVPAYIVFTEELFSSTSVKNDADVESILVNHELRHVKDFYHGITLGNIHLSYDAISPRTLRIDFLQELMELRATYTELEAIFREKAKTGNVSVSPEWLASEAGNYSQHFGYVKENATTDLEMRVRDLQLQEFQGITSEAINGNLLIKFNLFGKKDTATFKISNS